VAPGALTVTDAFDEVLARAWARFDERPLDRPLDQWLRGLLHEVLDESKGRPTESIDLTQPVPEAVRSAIQARVIGVTYDRHDNLLDVALEGGDHLILHPNQIWVEEERNGFAREIVTVREDGTREIVHLQHVGLRSLRG